MPNFNVRLHNEEHEKHVRYLAESIKSEGFYQDKPLAGYVAKVGEDAVIYLTDGHCRLEAVKLAVSEGAEIESLPMVIAPQGISVEDLTVSLVRSNSGKPLEPMELGAVCKRLVRYGWTEDAIASRLGFSKKHVANVLMLVGSDIAVREMVVEGKISASTAIEAIHKHGDKAGEKLQAAYTGVVEKTGGTRMTKKDMPEEAFKKRLREAANQMYEWMRVVAADEKVALSPEQKYEAEMILKGIDPMN